MRKLKNNLSLLLLFPILFSLSANAQPIDDTLWDCFSILVGKYATADGSVMFAHNEDDDINLLLDWYKVPRLLHKEGEKVTLSSGHQIQQVEETYGYIWLEIPGLHFSDSYINEWGLTIASDGCQSKETKGELVDGGIGYWLRRLMIERAKTTREAIRVATQLLDQLGYYGSGRSYMIADANEAWILAVVQGKHWVAQRVPDNHVAVVPNYYTIGEINLKDTANFKASPDIIEYAVKREWYNPKTDGAFHFSKVYSEPDNLKAMGNVARHWAAINLLSETKYGLNKELPFSFIPKKKVALQDLMKILADHYEANFMVKTNGKGEKGFHQNMAICGGSNKYGFVAQLRSWLPPDMGAVLWMTPTRPCIQPFIPWYCGITGVPEEYTRGDFNLALKEHFSNQKKVSKETASHAYWKFKNVADSLDVDYLNNTIKIKERKQSYEQKLLQSQKDFEKEVKMVYKDNPEKARQILTEYTLENASEVLMFNK